MLEMESREPEGDAGDDVERIRAHMERAILNAPYSASPLEHVLVGNVLPDEFYARLIVHNPFGYEDGVEWVSQAEAEAFATPTPYWRRKQIALPKGLPAAAPQGLLACWRTLARAVQEGGWWVKLMTRRFPAYFAQRYGPLTEADDFADHFDCQQFLQRHEPGYSIGPHTDVPSRVVTAIFSLADGPGFEDYGTQLCLPNDRRFRSDGRMHYDPSLFQVTKVAPYAPNRLLLFTRPKHSFHAVARMDPPPPNGRFGMQVQVWERNHAIFRDENGQVIY